MGYLDQNLPFSLMVTSIRKKPMSPGSDMPTDLYRRALQAFVSIRLDIHQSGLGDLQSSLHPRVLVRLAEVLSPYLSSNTVPRSRNAVCGVTTAVGA